MFHLFKKDTLFKPYAEVKSLSKAYEVAMNNVISNHTEVVTEDGEITWQSNPFTICITQPWRTNFIHKFSPYGKMFYQKYAKDILNGPDGDFVYDYHSRLFHYRKHFYDDIINEFVPTEIYGQILGEDIDQIQYVIDKLNVEKTSRRAVALTIQPLIDHVKKDIPCLQFIQFWIDEKNKLNMYCLFRSEDILGAFPTNVFGLYKLQKYVANHTDSNLGKYYHTVTIGHLYTVKNAEDLKKWIRT